MAKVLLYSALLDEPVRDEWELGGYRLFIESAQVDIHGVHYLTDDPATADVIIFAELGGGFGLFAELVRHHPFVKQYREKCFLFDSSDFSLPLLPGLYASLRRKYHDPARTRTGYYLRIDENPYIEFRPLAREPEYLGCFIGSVKNHPIRSALANLSSEGFLIEDTSNFTMQMLYGGITEERHKFWTHYADGMAAAAFSICPRGRGQGSIRLFESMCMGRCPVILADEWVFPERVDWAACSLTVAEKDISRLGEILKANLSRASELGMRARQEWERIYAPNVRFHWLVEDCLDLLRSRQVPEAVAGRWVWRHLVDKEYLRTYLHSKKQMYRKYKRVLF